MSIKTYTVKKLNNNSIEVEIDGANLKSVNQLRRVIMADVETISIDTVEIIENTTPIFDEVLAHQIGLIPLEIVDETVLNCSCDCNISDTTECSICQIEYTLSLKCTKGNTNILASYLKTNDKRIKINDKVGTTILTKIREDQVLKLIAKTQKGSGKIHAKWRPVSVISFVEVGETVEDGDLINPTLDPSEAPKYLFSFETTGQLRPEQVFLAGIKLVPELNTNFILK